MPRKTTDVVITEPGRDKGKVFRITEMPAVQAEKWANRATLALVPRLSREVSPEVAEDLAANPTMPPMGRIFRLLGGISFPELEPLLDELMDCVQVVPDPGRPQMPTRAIGLGGAEDDIEEIETIRRLREEVLNIHVGFTMAASVLSLMEAVSRVSISQDIPTSPPPSGPSSPEPRH